MPTSRARQLALRALGTNQHSHAVGQLEDAAEQLALTCCSRDRCSIRHWKGRPDYFVENQQGVNPMIGCGYNRVPRSLQVMSPMRFAKGFDCRKRLPTPGLSITVPERFTIFRKAQAQAKATKPSTKLNFVTGTKAAPKKLQL
jgi:hypothetical protein